jgi:hypothetical protein
MSGSEHAYVGQPVLPNRLIPAAAGPQAARPRFPLPLSGALTYAGIRVLSLAIAAYLLPRGKFHSLHYSLRHLMASWDSNRYLSIAVRGYSPQPGSLHPGSIFAWFPGYPAAIDTISWIPGISTTRAALAVTIAAGLATAWGLIRLGMLLTGDRRVSLLMAALWAVAPGSIALSMLYSEALFCAVAVWSLIALVERRWLTAAGLTILAGTVRGSALALVAAVAVAALTSLLLDTPAREHITAWWRPLAALLLAPLGLLGYWAYTARGLHQPGGWLWLEKQMHNSFDGGKSTLIILKNAIIYGPTAPVALTLLVIAAAVALTVCTLTERLPIGLHAYTLALVLTAIATGPYYLGSKPRFLLPAVLLGLPLARLLAPARTWLLIPLIAILAAASTWFGLYLMTVGWAP